MLANGLPSFPLFGDRRARTPVLHLTIGLDDDGCDVVVLGVALHECPSCMVKAIRKVRSRILVVGLNVVKHTLGSELVSVRRSRFCNSVGEEQRDLSGSRGIAGRSENLLPENRPSGGPVLSKVHFTWPESRNMKPGTWPALAYDRLRRSGFNRARKRVTKCPCSRSFSSIWLTRARMSSNSNCMAAKQRT